MFIDSKKIETVKEFQYLGIMLFNNATKPD